MARRKVGRKKEGGRGRKIEERKEWTTGNDVAKESY